MPITWTKTADNKHLQLYRHYGNTYEAIPWTQYWTTSTFGTYDICIMGKNEFSGPLTLTNFGIKVVSCDSGGCAFYLNASQHPTPSVGNALTVEIKVLSGSNITSGSVNISRPASANINFPGKDVTNEAQFGAPPYVNESALILRKVELATPIKIPNGQGFYVHLSVKPTTGDRSNNNYVRFILDESAMDFQGSTESTPYIWRYKDGQWKLVEPIWRYKDGQWVSVKDSIG